MGAFSWLLGGNDRELARTQYSERESATDRAARRGRSPRSATFGAPSRNSREAARRGQAWEDADRQRHTTTSWFRGRG
jgi:hypothetical protein